MKRHRGKKGANEAKDEESISNIRYSFDNKRISLNNGEPIHRGILTSFWNNYYLPKK
ncbi:MAG: hypothetical protein GX333_09135 [Syntrophomonadaceae bacterium]|nr:hypothetical protein [Syntrophomonadaceae bacterium]